MPCDTRVKRGQSLAQRKAEVLAVIAALDKALVAGTVKPKVGPQGAIAFAGFTDEQRDGVTDACAYRRLMVSGSAMARQAIAKAELLAGRSVDRQAVAQGHHSHDGGRTWHHGH